MREHGPNARFGAAWTALALAAWLSGCGAGGGGSQPAAATPAQPTPAPSMATAVAQALAAGTAVDPQIVSIDNGFGLSLFNTLNQGYAGNLAISPTSVALALQIVYNGAAGTTQQGMAQALRVQGLSTLQLDSDNAALQASLSNPDPAVQLTLANSLWMHLSDNPVLASFIQANQTYYAAQIGDLAGAPADVNTWVASQTSGLITQILPADFNPATADAVIVNAIYFKAPWSSPFDSSQTAAQPFTLADGSQVSCQMMHQSGIFGYLQGANFQMVRLPYGQDNHLSMIIALPAQGVSLASFVAALTNDELNTWIAGLQAVAGAIALPRFTSNYAGSLVSALTTLGMGVAFNPQLADFSGIAPLTYLSDVEHATLVQVDEAGTVAAGATSVSIGIEAVPANTFSMTMDHPFFYVIRDDLSGALLFIGTMVNPG